MAYATVADVEARTTRDFSAEEEGVISSLLDDAAALIDAANASATETAKKVVSCRMVIRAMGTGDGYGPPVGATQGSMTAGPYTQSWTVSSGGATGELYLSKTDRALLGAGNRIGTYSPVEALVPEKGDAV